MPLIPALGRQRQVDFWVPGQPGLQSKFEDSQSYTKKPCHLLPEPARATGCRPPRALEYSPHRRTSKSPGDHWWVERNISSKKSWRVLCQQEQGQRNSAQAEAGILASPAIFSWTHQRLEATKGPRVLSTPQDLRINSGSVVSGTQQQLQRIVEGPVTAGIATKEPRPTRGWDPFLSGPAPPSSAWTQPGALRAPEDSPCRRTPSTLSTLLGRGESTYRKGSDPRTQKVDQSSRLLDTCSTRGEFACRECSDHWDSGGSWTPRSADRRIKLQPETDKTLTPEITRWWKANVRNLLTKTKTSRRFLRRELISLLNK
jgi:hypothetical protein